MVLYVVAVGRVKDAGLRDACQTFNARIRRYLRLEIKQVRDAGRRAADAEAARQVESTAVVGALPQGARVYALTRGGRSYDSIQFARLLAAWQRDAQDVALVIGGPHGLDRQFLSRVEGQVSLSRMTLPHDLARLVLLEQIYRACTILRREPYHKGDRA